MRVNGVYHDPALENVDTIIPIVTLFFLMIFFQLMNCVGQFIGNSRIFRVIFYICSAGMFVSLITFSVIYEKASETVLDTPKHICNSEGLQLNPRNSSSIPAEEASNMILKLLNENMCTQKCPCPLS